MDISLVSAGKKYYREWIFRKVDLSIIPGQKLVILGPNGSGKSTLLQVIAGAVLPTEGNISFKVNQELLDPDEVYKHISFAAPYLELIEEFTLLEIINTHFKFKSAVENLNTKEILDLTGLPEKADNIFKYFSSGMKQRIKLALAILSSSEMLLLDEPCSNLDSSGIAWYKKMISTYGGKRTIVVASNEFVEEYHFCDTKLFVSDYKK